CERAVAAMLRIGSADTHSPEQVVLVRTGVPVAGAVEDLADLDAATEQLAAGGCDVGDDEVQALGGPGCCPSNVLAEDDRTSGPRRRELDHAEVITIVEVGVKPPPELTAVKLLRAINIGDGDDDYLELRVDSCDAGCVVATRFVRAHGWLLSCV